MIGVPEKMAGVRHGVMLLDRIADIADPHEQLAGWAKVKIKEVELIPMRKVAAAINIRTIACFLLLDKNLGVTIPIFVRKRLINGSWKITPKAKVKVPTKEIYLFTAIMGVISSVAKPRRNFMPMGTITK